MTWLYDGLWTLQLRAWRHQTWLRLLAAVAARLQSREIGRETDARYVTRYRLWGWLPGRPRGGRTNCYLHRIWTHDADPAPHNHPWSWAVAIVLSGGYREYRPHGPLWAGPRDQQGLPMARHLRFGSCNVIRADDYHRITSVLPDTWTLFITGPKTNGWGFRVGAVYVPWRERLGQDRTDAQDVSDIRSASWRK